MDSDDDVPDAVAIQDEEPDSTASEARHVPVTVITGFLGSGKTTLVRHILTEHHGHKVAVIMNEYGESVEGSYFHTPEGHKANLGEWVELSNGCMCCAVKSEFVQAIETLMTKRANFEHILIETTGLANPGPVAAALWTDEELEAGVQLDSIVTVVDAINIDRQLNDPRPDGIVNEAQVQVAYADLILLNKMDLAGEEAVVRAEADIKAINSSVQILRTKHCSVDLALILNRKRYMRGNAEDILDTIAEDGEQADDGHAVGGACSAVAPSQGGSPCGLIRSLSKRCSMDGPTHGSSRAISMDQEMAHRTEKHAKHPLHDKGIQTMTLSSRQPVDKAKFQSFMDRLLWDREIHPEDIYRVKGLLHIGGSNMKHIVQAVYELYNIYQTNEWGSKEDRQSKVVIIGRNLKRSTLEEWFQACLLPK